MLWCLLLFTSCSLGEITFTREESEQVLRWIFSNDEYYYHEGDEVCSAKLMNMLVDCTCQMGFVEALLTSFKTPPSTVTKLLQKIAGAVWQGYKTCNKAKEGNVYSSCYNTLVVNWRSVYNVRMLNLYPGDYWCS
eukprot:TRINITY_DN11304_c0_g1_i1.p1 TRINITY_DN11304_c0_g1~~TRINITY_DN11304_c0_g1_i1.p1  ORF type:complete len:135 (+),score=18.90 TRINITY_DN11304_c0_g1_i1:3-407(+)